MAERDIRKALKKRVEEYGGQIRAVKWIGRRNAPDVLALFSVDLPIAGWLRGSHPFIETKAPGGEPTAAQDREHKRMMEAGCIVLVISTFEQLDEWLQPR